MAPPPITTGKSTKKTENLSSATVDKEKEDRRKEENISNYFNNVMKHDPREPGMSSHARFILSSLSDNEEEDNYFIPIVAKASELAKQNKRSTIISRDIKTAIRVMVPDKLANQIISKGIKTIVEYNKNKCDSDKQSSSSNTEQ